jgi:DNA polymerase I
MNEGIMPDFKEIWAYDFEYQATPGEPPTPHCMVARELRTGRTVRLWADELRRLKHAPFSIGPDSLSVAYYISAEFSCFHALGWPLPVNVLDLFVEFRNLTNGTPLIEGAGLLGALIHFGHDALGFDEKEAMRALAIRGGPFTAEERLALLDYCETDVVALEKLFPSMLSNLDLPHALLRGRYMKAVSIIEKNGVPIDMVALAKLRRYWEPIKERLVARIDKDYGVFEGLSFKRERFEQYLIEQKLAWPRLESGALMLDEDTFREMARAYPQIAPLRELKHALSQLRLSGLSVGNDGRNRMMLSPFRSTTGRNQPSNTQFVFGPSCWIRGLIQPPPGHAVAYIDWSQQEFGIAAALSGDTKMMAAYQSGDPYLAFAKQAGAAPPDATKKTHGPIREQFKACVLAVQYGMGPVSLAARINQPQVQARSLLQLHRETYPVFWRWSDAAVSHAMLTSQLQTVFGWTVHMGAKVNERSLRNFPMQANGAEMLRLACCLMTESGIEVCATVHDAILIMAPSDRIDIEVTKAQKLMEDASEVILNGFLLRSDAVVVHHPDRYMDPRGIAMWTEVNTLIEEIIAKEPTQLSSTDPRTHDAEPTRTSAPGTSTSISPSGVS